MFKCDEPSVENVALGLHPRVTFSATGLSYLNFALTAMHQLYTVIYFSECLHNSCCVACPRMLACYSTPGRMHIGTVGEGSYSTARVCHIRER